MKTTATHPTLLDVLENITVKTATARENAVLVHDYVREHVKFGFNRYFDAAPPEFTLTYGIGHCNTKSRLMVVLLKRLGLEAYQHFVVIPKEILAGAMPAIQFRMISAEISHSFVDVNIEGAWCQIDSFIIDTPYLQGAKARLAKEGKLTGYGVRLDSKNTWDGRGSAFVQLEPSKVIEDHGRIEDLEAFYRSKRYRNTFMGIRFNTLFRLMGEGAVAPINAHIERIRLP